MGSRTRTIVADVAFGESPRWHDGRVWFCDWLDGDVLSVAPDGTDRRRHAHVDGFPICIDWLPDGNLVVVDGARRRLLHMGASGLEQLADLSEVSDRPWNEVVADGTGLLYLNGIGFDMMAGEEPTTGQVALVGRDRSVRQVADDLAFPNGMAISDDGNTLVVAESHGARLTAFTITGTGELTDRRTFAEIPGSAPDGICFAPDGTLWYADVPNRHCRRVADGGTILATVEIDRGCFSCALSPAGTLYITATTWNEHTFNSRGGLLIAVDVMD